MLSSLSFLQSGDASPRHQKLATKMAGTAAAKPSRRRRYPVAKVKGGWTEEEDAALKS